jgi:hypothetical protein
MIHLDVVKVNHDVAYIVMDIHVCFECMFQMFHLFFQTFVASVSSRCYICFTHILQSVLSGCCILSGVTIPGCLKASTR